LTLTTAYDFDGHPPSVLYRMPTVIAALSHAPTDLAPASKGDSFSYVHGPGIDDHRSRGRLGGDCHRQPAGRDERERASQLLVKTTTSGSVYYHHDGLGSTVALTDAAGAKIESYTYDVFGTVSIFDAAGFQQSSSTAGNRFLFTGREWITELGLYDYRNRVYSAELGRFLQTDPIQFDAGDGNLYRYVANDTINDNDPDGLQGGSYNKRTGGSANPGARKSSKVKGPPWNPKYGNWGGFEGGGDPVDDFDECFRMHDQCYDQCPDGRANISHCNCL
jgi:RHS repeat-associated protein